MPDTRNTSTTLTTREQWECNTSKTQGQECKTSATLTTWVQHKCYTNNTSATRVKNFDFDNYTSNNISSHLYIYSMASERLQGEEELPFGNALFHAKMRLKSAPQKFDFTVAANALARSRIVIHSNSLSFNKTHFIWKYEYSF